MNSSLTATITRHDDVRVWRTRPATTTTQVARRPRHATLLALENDLQQVAWGAAAGRIDAVDVSGVPVGLAGLPTALWLPGPADHPKSRFGLLPHPITWSCDLVVALTATANVVEATWAAQAWGTRRSGRVRFRLDDGAPPSREMSTIDGDVLIDTAAHETETVEVVVAPMTTRTARIELNRVIERATLARWSIHETLQPWLRRALVAAHRSVSAELNVCRVLDDLTLDDLFNEVHLGAHGRPGLIDKAIDRLVPPASRPNVDVGRYLATTFRRDTELALRRRIDDPRWVGPALRRFAHDHPELVGRDLIDQFNRSGCMSERIGLARAVRALVPAVQPETVNVPIELMEITTDLVDDSWGASETERRAVTVRDRTGAGAR